MSQGSTMKQNPLLWPGIAYPSGTSPFGPLRCYSQTVPVLESAVPHDTAGRVASVNGGGTRKRKLNNGTQHKGKAPMVCLLRIVSGKQVLNRILSSVLIYRPRRGGRTECRLFEVEARRLRRSFAKWACIN